MSGTALQQCGCYRGDADIAGGGAMAQLSPILPRLADRVPAVVRRTPHRFAGVSASCRHPSALSHLVSRCPRGASCEEGRLQGVIQPPRAFPVRRPTVDRNQRQARRKGFLFARRISPQPERGVDRSDLLTVAVERGRGPQGRTDFPVASKSVPGFPSKIPCSISHGKAAKGPVCRII
jgi:hypothetical protein